jgi:hypothetical protein
MKKKSFKNLILHKYSVSNLALLHRKFGGATDTNTDPGTATNTDSVVSILVECPVETTTVPLDLNTVYVVSCHTVGGDTKTQAPSEHPECNNGSMYAGGS